MPNVKISELTTGTTPTNAGDLFEVSQVSGATYASRKLTRSSLFGPFARYDDLGGAAYTDIYALSGIFVTIKNAAYTVTTDDYRRFILCNTSTPTLTLPAASTAPAGWHFFVKARGTTATISRAGSDTINGTTSQSVADGDGYLVVRSSSTSWETMKL